MAELFRALLPAADPVAPVATRPEAMTFHSLVGPRGRVWVAHNWSPEGAVVQVTADVDALLDGERLAAGDEVRLAPWGVAVWSEV